MSRSLVMAAALQLISAVDIAAQGKLSGTIRDSAGAPISGADVSVQNVNRQTTSTRRGEFTVLGIKPGTVLVSVRRIGYAPFSGSVLVYDGDNRLDVVLSVIPRELDSVTTRENQLWRERPLLREMDENRRVGLGQFVMREQLDKLQGGFVTQVFNQMRGLLVVRGMGTATWLANKYVPHVGGCTELEGSSRDEITPRGAACGYCFPDVYLDFTRISAKGMVPDIGKFSPDVLQGIEVFLGPAETPIRYAAGNSSCGVIVLHTRPFEAKPRRVSTWESQGPVRSRLFVNASVAGGKSGASCKDCGFGSSVDAMIGYTLNDRFVLSGRFAKWGGSSGGPQDITTKQALVEWYPDPEPGRFKVFANAGGGVMDVSLHTDHRSIEANYDDVFTGNGLPNFVLGTGMDIGLVRRFVVTPYLSYTRSIGGNISNNHCVKYVATSGAGTTTCFTVLDQQRVFTLMQFGTRFGWR